MDLFANQENTDFSRVKKNELLANEITDFWRIKKLRIFGESKITDFLADQKIMNFS